MFTTVTTVLVAAAIVIDLSAFINTVRDYRRAGTSRDARRRGN